MKKLVAILGATTLAVTLMAGTAEPQLQKASPGAASAKRATKHVSVNDSFYLPTSVDVAKGGKVKWNVLGGLGHTVTLYKAPKGIKKPHYSSRGTLGQGATFAKKFTKPGVYKYHCLIHPEMKMTVKVDN